MVLQDRTYTVSEYETFIAQHPDRRFELVNGEIVEKMPTILHGAIVHLISGFLFVYLQANEIGHAVVKGRYRLPQDDANSRIPDLSYFSAETGEVVEVGSAPFMPDLAVEVQSPDQSDREMTDRAAYYLGNGSRMVWLVYPDVRLVEVLTPDDRHLLTDGDSIDGSDVLPGLSIPVTGIFPKKLPTTSGLAQ